MAADANVYLFAQILAGSSVGLWVPPSPPGRILWHVISLKAGKRCKHLGVHEASTYLDDMI